MASNYSIKPLFFYLAAFLLFCSLMPNHHAAAATSSWSMGNEAQVRLISSYPPSSSTHEAKLLAGVHFKLAQGWRIYWRTPGDAGMPPVFNWQGSINVDTKALNIKWPAPQRMTEPSGLQDFIYQNEVIFPVESPPHDQGKETHLNLTVNYAVCKDVCIPLNATLSLIIPPDHIDPEALQLIETFQQRIPKASSSLAITGHRMLRNSSGETFLEVAAKNDEPFMLPDIFVEGANQLRFLKPHIRLADDRLSAVFTIPVLASSPEQHAEGKALHLTLVNNALEAIEADIIATAAVSPFVPAMGSVNDCSLILILGFALLGGLILNIMPCVLPVLSIKLFGIMKHSDTSSAYIRSSFIASALGIVTSFLAIAGSLIFLQSLGKSVGFGFQFQEPVFVITLVLILVIFACNLIGIFEIHLPAWLSNVALHKAAGNAQLLTTQFLTGAFATILATPCTAPFLGTAISFALLHSPLHILLIFTFMGIGMAVPYLLLACFPSSISLLPKPGQWMMTARYLLGVALLITALWLIYVLAGQLGITSALLLFLLCVLLKYFLEQRNGMWAFMPFKAGVVIVTIALAFYIPQTQSRNDQIADTAKQQALEALWKPFEKENIAGLVKDGHIVFVDVTADWCMTCKINKFTTLDRRDVMQLLQSPRVIAMRADITAADSAVNDYLASFERYGIPFNVVYGPTAPHGIPLPVLLTKGEIIQALKAAGLK